MTAQTDTVPDLRFPSFERDWEIERLGNLCSTFKSGSGITSSEISDEGDFPVYGGNGLRGYTDSYTHEGFYFLIGRQGALCGNINRVRSQSFISEHAIAVQGNEEADTEWLAQRLDYFNLNRLSESSAQPGLSVGKLARLKITVPTLPEQRKIADFLTAVDGRIGQLIQKKALLEDYKKGVMQQLFTQAIRFKDDHGNDFPDWEEKRVDEMFTVTRGKVLAMPETRGEPSKEYPYPVYSSQTKANGLAGYYDKYLFDNAITWTTDGANAGDVKFRTGEFYCTNVCGVLLSEKGYANEFVASILGTVTRQHVSYVGNPKLMNNVMSKISISVPSSMDEQTKVADFLSAIDRKIESVATQITETQTFKRGLLQQMFV